MFGHLVCEVSIRLQLSLVFLSIYLTFIVVVILSSFELICVPFAMMYFIFFAIKSTANFL